MMGRPGRGRIEGGLLALGRHAGGTASDRAFMIFRRGVPIIALDSACLPPTGDGLGHKHASNV